jgi:hypothetical protein
MFSRRNLAAAAVAGSLALPATAAAMPLDNGRVVPPKPTPAPTRVIVRSSPDALPIALAGAALLVAVSSAGWSVLRLAPLRS